MVAKRRFKLVKNHGYGLRDDEGDRVLMMAWNSKGESKPDDELMERIYYLLKLFEGIPNGHIKEAAMLEHLRVYDYNHAGVLAFIEHAPVTDVDWQHEVAEKRIPFRIIMVEEP